MLSELDEEQKRNLPVHRVMPYLCDLLRLLCVKMGVIEADLPAVPSFLEPPPPPEHDSDLDELGRILKENPALVIAIKTGDWKPPV